jgi:hypothetical protein
VKCISWRLIGFFSGATFELQRPQFLNSSLHFCFLIARQRSTARIVCEKLFRKMLFKKEKKKLWEIK